MIINIIFIIAIVLIVLIGLYLMQDNLKYIDYRNKAYLKAINKVKPKLKKWLINYSLYLFYCYWIAVLLKHLIQKIVQ